SDCQTNERANTGADQNMAAIENLQQQHPNETAGGEESPEPGHGGGTRSMRIVAMILDMKFGYPIRSTLLGANVGKHADEIEPDNRFAQQTAVHLQGTSLFLFGTMNLREAEGDEDHHHQQSNSGENPVHRRPGQAWRSESGENSQKDVLTERRVFQIDHQ